LNFVVKVVISLLRWRITMPSLAILENVLRSLADC
jgi:hypothetical protein